MRRHALAAVCAALALIVASGAAAGVRWKDRAADTVARLGGDEFTILLEDIVDELLPSRGRTLSRLFADPDQIQRLLGVHAEAT